MRGSSETLGMLNICHKFYTCSKRKKETVPLSLLRMYLNKNDIVYNYFKMCCGGAFNVSIINSDFRL